jgi:hypothetical protein
MPRPPAADHRTATRSRGERDAVAGDGGRPLFLQRYVELLEG